MFNDKEGIMNRIFVVYATDAWLSHASREMIGLCTSFENCLKVIRADIRKYGKERLTDYDKQMLADYRQTQGRGSNYELLELEKNVLLE